MSEEQVKAFTDALKADATIQEKLKGATDADAVVAIAKEAGFTITQQDVEKFKTEPLSEEELDGVAGGGNCGPAAMSY